MTLLRHIIACSFVTIIAIGAASSAQAQTPARTFGAGALQLDNRSTPLRSVTIDVPTSLTGNYSLHLPNVAPGNPMNFLVADVDGNMTWKPNGLGSLTAGSMWFGNASNVPTELPHGAPGTILVIDGSGFPAWSPTLPPATTVPASQITSGTLPPGTNITVGAGSSINPGAGTINANGIVGSGVGKFSGSVPIPMNTIIMNIAYPGIISSSVVLVSIVDPSGQTDQVSVTGISSGVGFTVQFSGFYPTTTGQLNYVVIN